MAIYDLGTASLAANGEVTGVGTTWKAPLTLIRVGATIVFKTEPVQIYTISEIISDTQVNVYNPNSETVPAGTGYAILAHDGITVQGLAQDVSETLRYYQSRETEVSTAVDVFKDFDQDKFSSDVNEAKEQLDRISNMSVVATNLPPGAPATGSFDSSTAVFSFGIPEGQPGKDGTDGTDGITSISDIGDVSIGTPVSDDYGFFVDKDNGVLYRTPISEIANLNPAVVSFNGRTGPVVPADGDYTVSQVTGAAASGVNNDIKQIRGLTTALSVSQGGTGAKTATDARVNIGVDRFRQYSTETEVLSPDKNFYLAVNNNSYWGCVDAVNRRWHPLGIGQGGTGGTTADGARSSLAAAKSGVNSDITSMTSKVSFTQSAVFGDNVATSTGIQIGGAVPSSGTDGIRMFSDGSSGWLGVRASKWPHPTEMAIYPSSKSGACQTISGSNAVKILSGASITSEAIGKPIAIYDVLYTVASVTSDGFTVKSINGTPVTWGSNATHTYSLCYYHGSGVCSISGTTVTRISGDPFVIPDPTVPQTMTINGIDYRVVSFTDPQHVTLNSAPGDSTSTEYKFWGTVDSLNTALRVHRINDAGFEENISLIANNGGYYALHAAASNPANEQYPLYIGSGWEDNGQMRRSIISAANGDVTLGGNYGKGPLYVPYSQTSNPQVMLDNRDGDATVTSTGGSTPDASLAIRAKGAGRVVFHSEVSVNAAIYPLVDNVYSCGRSGNRWSQIWASNATIQTSDGTTKTEVQGSNLSTDFILGLNPVSYKNIVGGNVVEDIEDGVEEIERQVVEKVVTSEEVHERVVDGDEVYYVRKLVDKEVERPVFHEVDLRDELGNVIGKIKTPLMEKVTVPKTRQVITEVPGKRTHYGFIAQEVKELVDKLGISDFGGYVEGEDGKLGLRYGEFISPIVSCLQDVIKRLELLEKK